MASDEDLALVAATIDELNRALDAINDRLLEACMAYTRERTVERFDAWLAVNREYVATHRRWWALINPDVDYDSVFGEGVALTREAIDARPHDN